MMKCILIILLVLFLIYVAVPLVRLLWTVYKVKKQMRNVFDRMQGFGMGNGNMGADEDENVKEKIFNENAGEYVEFEEIASDGAEDELFTPDTTPKSRIEDASWEDIK